MENLSTGGSPPTSADGAGRSRAAGCWRWQSRQPPAPRRDPARQNVRAPRLSLVQSSAEPAAAPRRTLVVSWYSRPVRLTEAAPRESASSRPSAGGRSAHTSRWLCRRGKKEVRGPVAMESGKEVVVVTGGSGFLGQHVVKHLRADATVGEIRVLDVRPYVDNLGGGVGRAAVHWVGADLAAAEDAVRCEDAFRGAHLVIHCAALVDHSHPADLRALHRNNVQATETVVSLCQRMGVPRLVFTSTLEVVLVPYLGGGLGKTLGAFALIVNQTEARALPPRDPDLLGPYAASKLRAERVVLAANGSRLHNGGVLRTVALRPPLMYGEEDRRLVPGLLRLARLCDNTLLQLGGANNRQQHAYVGNVAWAHVCAARALAREAGEAGDALQAQAAAGLPVFVTDDSPRGDVLRLAQLLLTFPDVSGTGTPPLVRLRAPPLPSWLSYLGAAAAETLLTAFLGTRLPVRPSAFVSYLSSFVSLSRLRAETRLRYSPKYAPENGIARSRAYYARAKDLEVELAAN